MFKNFVESEDGVSEIVGEMMLLSITVSLVAIVSVVLWSQMNTSVSAPLINMAATTVDGSTITLQHSGGDTMSYSDLFFNTGGTPFTTASPSVGVDDLNSNGLWEPGETITINMGGATTLAIYDNKANTLMDKFTIGM